MFKSWFISNIEIIFIPIYIILAIILQRYMPGEYEAWAKILSILAFGFLVYGLLVYLADIGIFGSILVGLLALVVVFLAISFVWGGLSGEIETSAAGWAGVAVYFIISFVISVVVAVLGFKNFDDVVDTRWLFRNSDVSIYEAEWKYALNRFAVTLAGFSGIAFVVYLTLAMDI